MGEPGLPPLAPAFANALARLGAPRQRELPFKLG
jgi:isoquinoline 1-oxidoreductase beta subunit